MKHSLRFLQSRQWQLTLGLYSHMQWCAQKLGKVCCLLTRKEKVNSNTVVWKTRHKLYFESIVLFISGIHCTVSVSVGDTWIQLLLILTSQFNKSAFAFNQQGHWLSPTKSLPISTSWSAAGNLPLNRQWTPGSSALPQSCLWLKVFNIRFLVTYSYNISLIYLIPFELGGCYFWRLHFTDFIAGHKTWNT